MPQQVPDKAMEAIATPSRMYAKRRAVKAATILAERKIEALNLYEPLPYQDAFHACTAKECMMQGGNRGGKSVAAFVEDARALMGRDPYDKYPKENGVLALLGYKEWHIGNVIYPFLFKAGAFKIIRDQDTQEFRVYRPWVPQDLARKAEAKPAPPLIPRRMIEDIAYKDKKKNIFTNAYLKNGWEIKTFASTAKPDQGYQADLFHIDEDIQIEEWYQEAIGRLVDRGGKLRWSALPHDHNDALSRLAERAEDQAVSHENGGPKPRVVVIRVSMQDNPFTPAEDKAAAIEAWKSQGEDVYRKRALGELVTDSVRMYPSWRREVHAIDRYPDDREVKQYLDKRQVPRHWCLRLAVDPGHDTGAALLIATPPSGNWHLAFDELYIRGCTAKIMGSKLKIVTDNRTFENFLIDAHGGSLTSLVSGETPRAAYEQELADLNVRCEHSGHRFTNGCDAIAYREEIVRIMLAVRPSGMPQLLFDPHTCPNLDREMKRFKKKRINGQITDTGNRRHNTHAVECLEYLSVYLHEKGDDAYVPPPPPKKPLTPGQRRVRAWKQRQADKRAARLAFGTTSAIILGPTGVSE